jgi:hypothetical protein
MHAKKGPEKSHDTLPLTFFAYIYLPKCRIMAMPIFYNNVPSKWIHNKVHSHPVLRMRIGFLYFLQAFANSSNLRACNGSPDLGMKLLFLDFLCSVAEPIYTDFNG